MQTEILKRGPITCSIATPDDFTYDYRGGIFRGHTNSTAEEIDHDVEVVGWGTQNGVNFWRVRNSWGTFWGKLVCIFCAGHAWDSFPGTAVATWECPPCCTVLDVCIQLMHAAGLSTK